MKIKLTRSRLLDASFPSLNSLKLDDVDPIKYEMSDELIGEGSYGTVFPAVNTETNEKVAIKKMLITCLSTKVCLMSALREIRLLRHLDHDNIINLKDVIIPSTSNFMDIRLVYPLMETDLRRVIFSRSKELTNEDCKKVLVQLLQGLDYLHSLNIIHRDLKPANILINSDYNLKICDFGMSRIIANQETLCAEHLGTSGYRAPELLVGCKKYGTAVDVWSVGVILAELLGRRRLFTKADNSWHEIKHIMNLLGTHPESDFKFIEDVNIVNFVRLQNHRTGYNFADLFPIANHSAVDLLTRMLTFDPSKRITVAEALEHPYIRTLSSQSKKIYSSLKPVEHPEDLDIRNFHEEGVEKIRDLIWNEMLHYHPERAANLLS